MADTLRKKVELASITSPNFPLVERIKEGLEHDHQAKNLEEAAK